MTFNIILCTTKKLGIGKNNKLPWNEPDDLAYFKYITNSPTDKKNALIMGYNTYKSIGKPLDNRISVVVCNRPAQLPDSVYTVNSLENALDLLRSSTMSVNDIFVIGGASLYNEAIIHSDLDKVYITFLDDIYDCDTFVLSLYSLKTLRRSFVCEVVEGTDYGNRHVFYKRHKETLTNVILSWLDI